MRIKRIPNFHTEVMYRESPEKADRIRQLWDLLISLPNPEPVPIAQATPPLVTNKPADKHKNNHEKNGTENI